MLKGDGSREDPEITTKNELKKTDSVNFIKIDRE